jgi:ATP-dependent DNA ligase
MKFPTLYKRTTTGATQIWTIEVQGNTYFTKSGQIDGKIQTSKPTICSGVNIGKSNETTPEQQAIVEAQAKYAKQLKSKYKVDLNDIENETFISPTLAMLPKKRTKPIVYPAYIQTKYNGVCCLIDKEFGSRTRTGEIFYNIKHINKELEQFFIDNPDIVLHGELFNYDLRRSLNRLIKLVAVTRKEKDLTPELIQESEEIVEYWVYDGYVKGQESTPYLDRIKYIHDKIKDLKYIKPAPTYIVTSMEEISDFFDASLADGQEGAIVRMMNAPYAHKRTPDILKFKEGESAEFMCIGFLDGTGNWAGIAKKAIMILPNGKTFNCNIKGSQDFLREVWNNQEKYINKEYTCDFQCWSEYGVPQIGYTGLVSRVDAP